MWFAHGNLLDIFDIHFYLSSLARKNVKSAILYKSKKIMCQL